MLFVPKSASPSSSAVKRKDKEPSNLFLQLYKNSKDACIKAAIAVFISDAPLP